MKRYSLLATGAVVAIGMLLATATTTTAQNSGNATDANRASQNRDRLANRNSTTGRLDSKTQGTNLRASQIIGMNIYNQNEESVGEVNDIVLDANSGKVRYAAVTYGGFLGLGDEMFAVPWEAFSCQAEKGDPDDHFLMLKVSKEQMDGAKGFDQDNWPNFADRNFTNQIDQRYGIKRDHAGNVNVDVNRNGVNVDVDRNNRND